MIGQVEEVIKKKVNPENCPSAAAATVKRGKTAQKLCDTVVLLHFLDCQYEIGQPESFGNTRSSLNTVY